MKDPLGVSPSKGNQGTTRGKEKILLTSVGIEPTTSGVDLPTQLRGRTEKVGDDSRDWWPTAETGAPRDMRKPHNLFCSYPIFSTEWAVIQCIRILRRNK